MLAGDPIHSQPTSPESFICTYFLLNYYLYPSTPSIIMSTADILSPPTRQNKLRRLSSQNVTRSDLYGVPTVIGPEKSLSRRSSAHETAQSMELARHRLAEDGETTTPDISGPPTPEDGQPRTTDDYAFAFDIDGVLIKGGEVIPEAIKAMQVLNGENEFGVKVYVFCFCPHVEPTDNSKPLHFCDQWRRQD